MKLSLRRKVVLIAVAVLLLVLGTNTAVIVSLVNKEYKQALQDKTLVVAESLKLQLDRLLSLGIPLDQLVGFEEQSKEVVDRNEEISAALVVDAKGRILFHSDPTMAGKSHADSKTVSLIENKQRGVYSHLDHYEALIPLLDSNESVIGAVVIEASGKIISKKAATLFIYILIASVTAFIVAVALISVSLTKWFTRPLGELVSVIRQIGTGGDLAKKVNITSADEIGQLAGEFNAMAVKLQESYGALEQKVRERTGEVEEAKRKVEAMNQELSQKVAELEKTNKMMVGRELKMAELKKEIEELKKK